jgi:alpha-glucosidase (family GH31 glycosyl hydrolase)
MLNRGLTGAFGFGTDIGGYLDYYNIIDGKEVFDVSPTTRELFLRWSEWAALTPIFRLHGAIVVEHTPWSFPKTLRLYESIERLHVSAAHLIEQLWEQADQTGVGPLTTPVAAELSQLPFFFRCGTRPFTPPPRNNRKPER